MMASDKPESSSPDEIPLPPIQVPKPEPTYLKPSPLLMGLDIFQAAGVVIFTFLLASFAINNSDFFRHLAAGRLISEGNYSFGKDPFSFTTENDTWVNHSWIYDWVKYQIYSKFGEGAIVVVKATLLALLATILLMTRKSTHPLWFGVVGVGMAMLASAPRFLMQSTIDSFFFFGCTLFVLMKIPSANNSWRLPIAISLVFAFWSNCDQWFFLGPLTVALFLIGETIQSFLKRAEDEPFHSPKMLAITLVVGILACMANPHHVRVWTLPAEFLGGGVEGVVVNDRELSIPFWGIFQKEKDGTTPLFNLFGSSRIGNPMNAFALLFLTLYSIVGFLLNIRHIRWSLLLLWLFFFLLGVLRYRSTPMFCIVSVVVSTWNYGEFVYRFTLNPIAPTLVPVVSFTRSVARIGSLLIGIVLIVMVRPGWLNQSPNDRHLARWLTWEVNADPGYVQAAKTLEEWRQSGRLPAEARGLILHPDFAHYVAWYAPSEKSFFDFRWQLHADRAEEYALLREWFGGRSETDQSAKIEEILNKYKITHVILASTDRSESFDIAQLLLLGNPYKSAWTPWLVEGKVWVFGRNAQQIIPKEKFDQLTFRPSRSVFALDVPLTSEPKTIVPYAPMGWLETYWDLPLRLEADIDDSFSMWGYYQILQMTEQQKRPIKAFLLGLVAGSSANALPPNPEIVDSLWASSIRSVRDARNAIAQSSDVPEPFLALARVYGSNYPTLNEFQILVTMTSNQRALLRADMETIPRGLRLQLFTALSLLAESHRQANRWDMLVDTIDQMTQLKDLPMNLSREQITQILNRANRPLFGEKGLPPKEYLDRVKDVEYENMITGLEDSVTRSVIARQFGLYSESRKELMSINLEEESTKDSPARALVDIDLVELDILHGFVEEAYIRIRALESRFGDRFNDPQFLQAYQKIRLGLRNEVFRRLNHDPGPDVDFRRKTRDLKVLTSFLVGKLSEAAEEQELGIRDLEQQLKRLSIPADLIQQIRRSPTTEILQLLTTIDLHNRISPFHQFSNQLLHGMVMGRNQEQNEQFQALELLHVMHLKAALIHVERGANKEAFYHFEQAAKPMGISLPVPSQALVSEYLQLYKRTMK